MEIKGFRTAGKWCVCTIHRSQILLLNLCFWSFHSQYSFMNVSVSYSNNVSIGRMCLVPNMHRWSKKLWSLHLPQHKKMRPTANPSTPNPTSARWSLSSHDISPVRIFFFFLVQLKLIISSWCPFYTMNAQKAFQMRKCFAFSSWTSPRPWRSVSGPTHCCHSHEAPPSSGLLFSQ